MSVSVCYYFRYGVDEKKKRLVGGEMRRLVGDAKPAACDSLSQTGRAFSPESHQAAKDHFNFTS